MVEVETSLQRLHSVYSAPTQEEILRSIGILSGCHNNKLIANDILNNLDIFAIFLNFTQLYIYILFLSFSSVNWQRVANISFTNQVGGQ